MRFTSLVSVLSMSAFYASSALAMGSNPLKHAPEIDSAGSLTALAAVTALAAFVWERRRGRK